MHRTKICSLYKKNISFMLRNKCICHVQREINVSQRAASILHDKKIVWYFWKILTLRVASACFHAEGVALCAQLEVPSSRYVLKSVEGIVQVTTNVYLRLPPKSCATQRVRLLDNNRISESTFEGSPCFPRKRRSECKACVQISF